MGSSNVIMAPTCTETGLSQDSPLGHGVAHLANGGAAAGGGEGGFLMSCAVQPHGPAGRLVRRGWVKVVLCRGILVLVWASLLPQTVCSL